MAVQILDLKTLQLGVETTRGTLVAATHVVDFESASLKIDRKKIRARRSGSLASSHRSDNGILDYELEINTIGTFDRIAWWLAFFIAPTITGTGAGADKTWAFVPSDSSDNLKSASIEVGGVDTWPTEWKLAGCVGRSFEINITQEGYWQCKWVFGAMKKTNAAKTGALSAPGTLEGILGFSTKVYIDTSTIGSTERAGAVISANIKCDLQTTPRHYLGSTTGEAGNLVQTGRRHVTLGAMIEWQALTEFTAWEANTFRKIRIEGIGSALGSGTYLAQLNFYGTAESWDVGDSDGALTEELEFEGQYDATAAADISASIVASVAAIT